MTGDSDGPFDVVSFNACNEDGDWISVHLVHQPVMV